MADDAGAFRIHGLDDAIAALGYFEDHWQDDVDDASRELARGTVDDARGTAYSLGGVAAKAAPAVSAEGDTVTLDVLSYPWAGGAEFGAIRYPQFETFLGSGASAGYFLYPAIRRQRDDAPTRYEDAIGDTIRKAGL